MVVLRNTVSVMNGRKAYQYLGHFQVAKMAKQLDSLALKI
jgi:hypothetical protein